MSDAEGDVDKLFESSDDEEAQRPQHSEGAADDDAAPDQLRDEQSDGSDAQPASSPGDDGRPAAGGKPLTANRRACQFINESPVLVLVHSARAQGPAADYDPAEQALDSAEKSATLATQAVCG